MQYVLPQTVIVTQNVITLDAKCNNIGNAKCDDFDAKCNTQKVTQNVIAQNEIIFWVVRVSSKDMFITTTI